MRFFSSLAVGRKFELVSVITPDALPVLGDRIQLQQVILNLVVNGIDAMRDTPSRKSHHQHPDFSRRELCPAIRVGSRLGHSRRQIRRGLRTVFHQQGGRHGHGTVHRAHHNRGAPRADIGKQSGSWRRVVPDQASSLSNSWGISSTTTGSRPTSAAGTWLLDRQPTRLTRCRQRVGAAAVDLDQLETLHSPLSDYFFGSRDAGFVITLRRNWSVGHSLLGRSSQ